MSEVELVLAVGIVIVVIASAIVFAYVSAKTTALAPVPTIAFEVGSIHNLVG
jgi:hypothetical protein